MSERYAARGLLADEGGAASVWMLFWSFIFIVLGGVAVDSASGWRERAVLQAAADAAALAAATELPDEAEAAEAALALAAANMAPAAHGEVLKPADIEFGAWDAAARAFDADAPHPDAVRVTLRRAAANGNPAPTYLLRLAGLSSWDIGARAVAQRYTPECLNDGLFARGFVNISSNNAFSGKVCVHGQSHVAVNNNNVWGPGVAVSMPDLDDFVIPTGGWESNENIEEALIEEWFDPRLVDRIDEIIAGVANLDPAWLPAYIDPHQPTIEIHGVQNFDPTSLEPGRVYVVWCKKPNNNLNMGNGVVVSKVAIVSDCKFSLGANAVYSDVLIASTAAEPGKLQESLISIGQGTTLGAEDGCAPGGGVNLISTASIDGAADSRYFGTQVLAAGDVTLAAGQGGVEGLQGQAGGNISLTSNNVMGACAGGVDAYAAPYFRLVL